jgi:hypothetical protein
MKPDANLILESRTAILPFLSLLGSSELFELTSLPLSSLSVLISLFNHHTHSHTHLLHFMNQGNGIDF